MDIIDIVYGAVSNRGVLAVGLCEEEIKKFIMEKQGGVEIGLFSVKISDDSTADVILSSGKKLGILKVLGVSVTSLAEKKNYIPSVELYTEIGVVVQLTYPELKQDKTKIIVVRD